MLLGKISGRITTKRFGFEAKARVKKMDYVMVKDPEGKWILACIDSIIRYENKTKANAIIIGYRDKRGFLKTPGVPFAPGTPVYAAENEFIKEVLGLIDTGLYIGLLEGYNIPVNLPVQHVIKKHIAILAKTGTGKSYLAGILLEEFAENRIPVVVIDPHGEYFTLKRINTKVAELKFAERFGIKPKSYKDQVNVFGLRTGKQLKLNSRLTPEEIFQMLPTKIPSTQKGILYSSIKNLEGKEYTLRDIIEEVEAHKSQSKWNLISMLEFLMDTKLFSANPILPEDVVEEGKISIIDLKEAKPEVQQIAVLKLVEELFTARKHNRIPEFLLVLEEAHNFCPERGFGEVACSRIIRTIASEGRKFGLGLCIISQRPARVDKNVLSQCNTQIILKVTNPNDLKAITDSVEGITQGIKEEIKDLSIGVAMVVGVTDQPLLTDIRIRRSEHGGETIKIESCKELSEDKVLRFQQKCSQTDIEQEFKGIESISLLNYPFWMLKSRYNDTIINLYVDGIVGEVIFQSVAGIKRSRGIRTLLELPPSSRSIMFYLIKHKHATMEKLSDSLKIPTSAIHVNIKNLLSKKYLATDGYMFRSILKLNIPKDLSVINIDEKPSHQAIDGMILDFMISSESARKVSELWGLKVIKTEPVYYPYWLIKHKNKKVLIDALHARIDMDASEAVKKLI
jgi:hypothetical protein